MADQKSHSVVITGASRGIGRRIAQAFARETDYALLLVARTESDLKDTQTICRNIGDNHIVIAALDAAAPKAVQKIKVPEDFPTPKIIINNAGSFLLKPLQKTTHEEFTQQVQANLFSAVNITNRFLDDLKSKSNGLVINICSVGAVEGLEDSGAYSASKHALLGYTRSLRQELMETEVGVTAINLGQTQSTSWEGSLIDRDLLIDPDDVANIILNLTQLSPRTVVEEILVKPQHGRVPPM
ncbi:SDR family oxidoreductase [Aliifodinibius salipaludis]|uniref:SDR family oxidoreductase n=1 Tax=Fodinibius salipaludis TaxID=2032627 RepID=A0A2A2GF38_9BACT|nr:SDR family oxidoreductase [Aliifodinibius salipaludis]PAU95513.1 SDR family oxidoreductase [Aliifodinibius salipaludis]